MVGTDGDAPAQPLLEPRLVRFLKNRPRLVDRGLREEFLDQLETNIRQRRRPDTMAEKSVQELFRRFEEAGGSVAKNRTKQAMERANEGPLRNL